MIHHICPSRLKGATNLRLMTLMLMGGLLTACSSLSTLLPNVDPQAETAVARINTDGRILDGRAKGRFETDSTPAATAEPKVVILAYPRDLENPHAKHAGGIERRWLPERRDGDSDADGVANAQDRCPDTQQFVTVNKDGCGLFDAVLDDVVFDSNSFVLGKPAREQLKQLAETLLAFPESRIRILAHTDRQGQAKANMRLSQLRADAVVEYLRSRGVEASQLQAVGMGETQALPANDSEQSHRQNRRVEIVTLPDRDAVVLSQLPSSTVPTDPLRSSAVIQKVSNRGTLGTKTENFSPAAPAAPAASTATAADDPEPSLQAALSSMPRDPLTESRRAQVLPLPQPGIAPAAGIAGVIENLSFASGSSELTSEGLAALAEVGDTLLVHPEVKIVVMAHTDNVGDAEDNLALSRARAEAVVAHLVSRGVEADRLKAEGYGERLPLVQNMTEADRAINRRVEIRVQRPERIDS